MNYFKASRVLSGLIVAVFLFTANTTNAQDTRLLRQPNISDTQVVFAYGSDIWVADRNGGNAVRVTSTPAVEKDPYFSPDGQWIAYTSDESGRNEVMVRSFPNINEERKQISNNGGDSPLWSPDGRELFYRSGDMIMAVSVDTDPTFSYETPRMLFEGKYIGAIFQWNNFDFHTWDIHPDGKRFLMMKQDAGDGEEPETGAPSKINIVVNWFEELKDRVPME